MELKLNIYDKKTVVKTYKTESYDLMFGTIEDLINILDLENVNLNDDSSLISVVTKFITGGMDIIKPLLKDIFEGLSDDELRKTKLSEIATVLVNVVVFAVTQMGKGSNGKN